ncbi:MAG: hypothetical protein WB799_18285 [Candidatus Sulfotelmatobacter sp.]
MKRSVTQGLLGAYALQNAQRELLARDEPEPTKKPVEVKPDPIGDRATAYGKQLEQQRIEREQRVRAGDREDWFTRLQATSEERKMFARTPTEKLIEAITQWRRAGK